MSEHLLEVTDLHTSFNVPAGEVRSVNGVSFTLDKGEVVGIVGESGSGKSVTSYSILQILQNPGKIVSGSIKFKGKELVGLTYKQLQKIRGNKISIIFQDAMISLNPVFTIGNQLIEVLKTHPDKERNELLYSDLLRSKDQYKEALQSKDKKYIKQKKDELTIAKKAYKKRNYNKCVEMLKLVGINEPEKRMKQYPFECSGGMLQRIMIAMALICNPDVLIADEPTTALDVTIQAQILELMKDLQKKFGMGIIIITHDLGVVAQICDRVNVMYAGRIVETGTVEEIFYNPQHEYTKGLMNSIPKKDSHGQALHPIAGNPVDVLCLPKGCSFGPRCEKCMDICLKKFPNYYDVNKNHKTACFEFIKSLVDQNKITKAEFDKYLEGCKEGNAAFIPTTYLDVYTSRNAYLDLKEQFEKDKNTLNKDERETEKNKVKVLHVAYKEKVSRYTKQKLTGRSHRNEALSILKSDFNRKIKNTVKEIKTLNMDQKQFDKYLSSLHILPPNLKSNISENELNELKALGKKPSFKGMSRVEIQNTKLKYHNARDEFEIKSFEYKKYQYFTKKYEKALQKFNKVFESQRKD